MARRHRQARLGCFANSHRNRGRYEHASGASGVTRNCHLIVQQSLQTFGHGQFALIHLEQVAVLPNRDADGFKLGDVTRLGHGHGLG